MQGVLKLPSGGFKVCLPTLPPPVSDTGSQDAGLWGLETEGKRQDADPAPGLQL